MQKYICDVLVRQACFPNTYRKDEVFYGADTNFCLQHDPDDYCGKCLNRRGIKDISGFEAWLADASDEEALKFIVEFTRAKAEIIWTGYRVMVSFHPEEECLFWTLELFSRNPRANTRVYTGVDAPNVKKRY